MAERRCHILCAMGRHLGKPSLQTLQRGTPARVYGLFRTHAVARCQEAMRPGRFFDDSVLPNPFIFSTSPWICKASTTKNEETVGNLSEELPLRCISAHLRAERCVATKSQARGKSMTFMCELEELEMGCDTFPSRLRKDRV